MMMVPVMAKPTRNGQLRLNSLLKKTGHGSNFLILLLSVCDDSPLLVWMDGDIRHCGYELTNTRQIGPDTLGLDSPGPHNPF